MSFKESEKEGQQPSGRVGVTRVLKRAMRYREVAAGLKSQSIDFVVGERFKAFDVMMKKMKEYENHKCVKLWKRDSRTVQAAQKRLTRPLHEQIRYYEVSFCCIHGGKMFRSKGKGKRFCS